MPRRFNTSGPNDPRDHYTLPVMTRLPEVRELIEDKLYFVLHAPRQVGKTTTLLTLAKELTAEGSHVAALLSMEQGAPFSNDPGAAELTILASWRRAAEAWLPPELQPPPWPDTVPGARIGAALSAWAQVAPRPLVVFLDEIDALHDETLLSILRQIRGGFPTRPSHFPHSLALIGLRDVRDYRVATAYEGRLGTAKSVQHQGRVAHAPRFHPRRGRATARPAHHRDGAALHHRCGRPCVRAIAGPALADQRAGATADPGPRSRSRADDHHRRCRRCQGAADPSARHPPRQPEGSPP